MPAVFVSVSVIMGVYNTQSLDALERAVDSVLNQSFKDFELIICDDCSDKYISDFLKIIQERDPRVIITANAQNLGLAASLNRCIELSSPNSRYIFRQDDDDYSETDRFLKLFELFEREPGLSIIGSNIALFDDSGKWGALKYPEYPQKRDFLFLVPFMHGAVAFKKADLVDSGCYLSSERTRRTEDYELFMRMYSRGYTGYNIQEELYSFREDLNAHQRRRYKYRTDEFIIRLRGFKSLGLMPLGFIFAVKPLIVGLVPYRLLNFMKDIFYGRRKKS